MTISSLGSDGVYRRIGFHAPGYTEPYVLDYRQLDPDQVRQCHAMFGGQDSSDLPNLPDGRDVVDKKQLFEPDELNELRTRKQRSADHVRRTPNNMVSPSSPLDARYLQCHDFYCTTQVQCYNLISVNCNECVYVRSINQSAKCLFVSRWVPPFGGSGGHHNIKREAPGEESGTETKDSE